MITNDKFNFAIICLNLIMAFTSFLSGVTSTISIAILIYNMFVTRSILKYDSNNKLERISWILELITGAFLFIPIIM